MLFGSEDSDVLFGGGDSDELFGEGADLPLGSSDDILFGDHGYVTFQLASGTHDVHSLDLTASDPYRVSAGDVVIVAHSQSGAGDAADTIHGGDGHNLLFGGGDGDIISAGPGNDEIFGDHGRISRDAVTGDSVELLSYEPSLGGNDQINPGDGFNLVIGGSETDTITGGQHRDVVVGDHGLALFTDGVLTTIASAHDAFGARDIIDSGEGDNEVIGGFGNDSLRTRTGRDIVLGDNGEIHYLNSGIPESVAADDLDETTGADDVITAGTGENYVFGGVGGDTITTGSGVDHVVGDNGAATFTDNILTHLTSTDLLLGAADIISAGPGVNRVLGGYGSDEITTGDDADLILGDNGEIHFQANGVIEVARSIDLGDLAEADDLILAGEGINEVIGGAGSDNISTGDDLDLVVGDNAEFTYHPSGVLQQAQTILPILLAVADDVIAVGEGLNRVLGGVGSDTVTSGSGVDLIVGDNGQLRYRADTTLELLRTTDLAELSSSDDIVSAGDGQNQILGGVGQDTLTTGSDGDLILGDNGEFTYDLNGLISVAESTDQTTLAATDDVVLSGDGLNQIVGGLGTDTITTGIHADLVLGDNARLTYLAGVLTLAETVSPELGAGDVLDGDEGDDTLIGGFGADTVRGRAGNDLILGDAARVEYDNAGIITRAISRDLVAANAGDDILSAGTGNNQVVGGGGADTITAGMGSDVIVGDNAQATYDNGVLMFVSSSNTWESTPGGVETEQADVAGDDSIAAGDGSNLVLGGGAADTIFGALVNSTQVGGADRDIFVGDHGLVMLDPLTGYPLQVRTQLPDVGGNDTLIGGTGGDHLLGGAGNDAVFGDSGSDLIVGGNGIATYSDNILREMRTTDPEIVMSDDDTIDAGSDADVVLAGNGMDQVFGGDGSFADVVIGDNGTATFDTAGVLRTVETFDPDFGADDTITLGDGQNVAMGGAGNDRVTGGQERDVILGDHGRAIFDANRVLTSVNTTIPSEGGDDDLLLGEGDDLAFGGVGSDYINLDRSSGALLGTDQGVDVVLGDNGAAIFDASPTGSVLREVVTSDLGDAGADFIFTDAGADVVIGGSQGDSIWSGADDDRILGDNGVAHFDASERLVDFSATDPNQGGADVVYAGAGADVVVGGADADSLYGESGDDLLFGDHADVDYVADDVDPDTLDLLTSTFPLMGGDDQLFGGDDNDVAIGGTGNDQISGGTDHDILLGDHARLDLGLPRNQFFESIFTSDSDGAGADTIHGDAGDDFLLGQQGGDLLFGDAGEDDITGGHNVRFGEDGDDQIDGGSEADVILGDNGRITRSLLENQSDAWERYPAPFADVIRHVERYDDIDGVEGHDTILGQGGDDIVHGQRGNDTIDGGSGDDELLGELGDDTIVGGDGHDVLLADVGRVVRDLNDNGTPRRNENGWWHRDVFLEDVATIAGSIDLDQTPLRSFDPELAEKMLRADLIVVTGAFDAVGQKVVNSDNGAWDTELLLINVAPANNDELSGGNGDDLLFGQRGDDLLRGGDGNDWIVGDSASNQVPFKTELPHVVHGLRLIGLDAGVTVPIELAEGGSVIVPPATLRPEEISLNDPFGLPAMFGNVVSHLVGGLMQEAGAGPLLRSDGAVLTPYATVISDVANHADVLPGNDAIYGDGGDDFLIGDNAEIYAPLLTGLQSIDDAVTSVRDTFKQTMHTAGSLAIDFDQLEHQQGGTTTPHTIRVGSDRLEGGAGNDQLMADDSLIIGSFTLGLPVPEDRFVGAARDVLNFLLDLQYVATDLEHVLFEAHHRVIADLISGGQGAAGHVDPNLHDLQISNDIVVAGAGNDAVAGDDATLITPLVNGIHFDLIQQSSSIGSSTWTTAINELQNLETSRSAQLVSHIANHHDRLNRSFGPAALNSINWDYEYELSIGNDELQGNAGKDLMIGDFSIVAIPAATRTPANFTEEVQLQQDVRDLAENVARFLERGHHEQDDLPIHALYTHSHYGERGGANQEVRILAGSDTIDGGPDDDYLLGDSQSISVVYNLSDAAHPLSQTDFLFKVSYLDRSKFEMRNHYDRIGGGSRLNEDALSGGDGNDVLYGQINNDSLLGGPGNDLLYGGTGLNTASGGTGVNDVRPGSDDDPVGANLDLVEEYAFAGVPTWGGPLLRDMAADPQPAANELPFDPIAGNLMLAYVMTGPIQGTGVEIAGRANGIWSVLLSDGTEVYNQAWGTWSTAINWQHVQVADFDGDGLQDIVGRANNGSWWVARSQATEFVSERWGAWSSAVNWTSVLAGDFDGDGRDDLVGRAANGSWWVARSTGSAFSNQLWGNWSNQITWRDIQVADVNGDGRDDLVGRDANGVWWVARSDGTQFVNETWGSWSSAINWTQVLAADFDGDGRDDVVGRASTGAWWVARSTGSAFVNTNWGLWSSAIAWQDIQIADLNGDGRSDLVGRTSNGAWWVAESTGQAFANKQVTKWSGSVTWQDVLVADVDGDGRDDLLGRVNGTWWVAHWNGQAYVTEAWASWSNAYPWLDVLVGQFS